MVIKEIYDCCLYSFPMRYFFKKSLYGHIKFSFLWGYFILTFLKKSEREPVLLEMARKKIFKDTIQRQKGIHKNDKEKLAPLIFFTASSDEQMEKLELVWKC